MRKISKSVRYFKKLLKPAPNFRKTILFPLLKEKRRANEKVPESEDAAGIRSHL